MTDETSGLRLPQRIEILLVLLIAVVGLSRIVATYSVFSQTFDEPTHIGAAIEWLDLGTYRMSTQNPPLGRLATGIGPYLAGARIPATLPGPVPVLSAGTSVLYHGNYQRTLTLARVGNLFWFLAGLAVVWQWSRRLYGEIAGIAAAVIFVSTPAVLTFGSLATNDMPIIAALPAAIGAFAWWIDKPSPSRAALTGLLCATALLCKLTSAVFLPAAGVVLLLGRAIAIAPDLRRRWMRGVAIQFPIVLLAAFLLIWATYRFTVLPADQVNLLNMPEFAAGMAVHRVFERTGMPLPAPEFLAGIEQSWAMNFRPVYQSYFMGERRLGGFPGYYPIVFAVKTPIPLLLLLGLGALASVLVWRRQKQWAAAAPLAVIVMIFVAALVINVNTGIRYIAPVYAFVAITASACAPWLADSKRRRALRATVGALLIALVVVVAAAHPDYLPYFNMLAGEHPERIIVDGDLDWGQDLFRLVDEVDRRGITELWVAYFGTAIPDRHITGARVMYIPPNHPVTGWIAASEMVRANLVAPYGGWSWLAKHTPVARVGHSIYLYYIPPTGTAGP